MIPDNLEDLLKGKELPTEKDDLSDNVELLIINTLKQNSKNCKYYHQASFFNWLYSDSPNTNNEDIVTHREKLLHPIIAGVQIPPEGNKGMRNWSKEKQFEKSKKNSWADILCVANSSSAARPCLPDIIDVKSTGKKGGEKNNGVSLNRIETLCRAILENPEESESYNHHFIAVYHKSNKVVKIEVHDWFKFDWNSEGLMTGGGGQWQPNPFDFDQNFSGTRVEWANSFLTKLIPTMERKLETAIAKFFSLYPKGPESSAKINRKISQMVQSSSDYHEIDLENDLDYSHYNAINKHEIFFIILNYVSKAHHRFSTSTMEQKNWSLIPNKRAAYLENALKLIRSINPVLFDNEIVDSDIHEKLIGTNDNDFLEGNSLLVKRIEENYEDYCAELITMKKQNRLPPSKSPLFKALFISVIIIYGMVWLAS